MKSSRAQTRAEGDAGIGLVEILIAMMILAIIAIAILPVLMQGLQLSASNATFASATAIVNGQLEDARSKETCAGITPIYATDTDARGVVLKIVRTVGACPAAAASYPASIPVTVTVTRADTGLIISARSSVYVEGP